MYGIERRNVARVWCGVMPRVGSKRHMRFCPDCRAVKRQYWKLVSDQGSTIAKASMGVDS